MSKINTHVYVDLPFEVARWKCKLKIILSNNVKTRR